MPYPTLDPRQGGGDGGAVPPPATGNGDDYGVSLGSLYNIWQAPMAGAGTFQGMLQSVLGQYLPQDWNNSRYRPGSNSSAPNGSLNLSPTAYNYLKSNLASMFPGDRGESANVMNLLLRGTTGPSVTTNPNDPTNPLPPNPGGGTGNTGDNGSGITPLPGFPLGGLFGAPGGGVVLNDNGQPDPNSIQNIMQSVLQTYLGQQEQQQTQQGALSNYLNSMISNGLPNMGLYYQTGANAINQAYNTQTQQLQGRLAGQGMGRSGIGTGAMVDLEGQRANALGNMSAQLSAQDTTYRQSALSQLLGLNQNAATNNLNQLNSLNNLGYNEWSAVNNKPGVSPGQVGLQAASAGGQAIGTALMALLMGGL